MHEFGHEVIGVHKISTDASNFHMQSLTNFSNRKQTTSLVRSFWNNKISIPKINTKFLWNNQLCELLHQQTQVFGQYHILYFSDKWGLF